MTGPLGVTPAPEPTAPQPTAPQPTAPQPTAPQPTAPQPTAPQPTAPHEAVLALGANLGSARATLAAAVEALAGEAGIDVVAVSPVALTAPVGGPAGQPDYHNLVLRVTTTLTPEALLAAGHRIEARFGRERSEHWGPRTLDIDVVTVTDAAGRTLHRDDPALVLPHPRAASRAFVLAPWSWMEPAAVLDGVPVTDLLAGTTDRDGVRRVRELP